MNKLMMIGMTVLMTTACAQKQAKVEAPAIEPAPAVVIPTKAQALLKAIKGSKLKGIIHFSEENGKMKVETMVQGLKTGPHGFHIHEIGDCSAADFSSAGGHFNPGHAEHGSLETTTRHAGDLGNLIADKKKKAHTTIVVDGLSFKPGPNNIIGKSIVIHEDADDLHSQPAGKSGKRLACGVIEAL